MSNLNSGSEEVVKDDKAYVGLCDVVDKLYLNDYVPEGYDSMTYVEKLKILNSIAIKDVLSEGVVVLFKVGRKLNCVVGTYYTMRDGLMIIRKENKKETGVRISDITYFCMVEDEDELHQLLLHYDEQFDFVDSLFNLYEDLNCKVNTIQAIRTSIRGCNNNIIREVKSAK